MASSRLRSLGAWRPGRRTGGLLLLGVLGLGLYVAYEVGRLHSGYDWAFVSRDRAELEVAIERLESANRALRARLAELETLQAGRRQERTEVARTIGELQAEVARQAQELAFYRGIVVEGSAAIGMRVQQLRILPTEDPRRFRLRFTLTRSVRPDDTVSGVLAIRVVGAGEGGSATLEWADLGGTAQPLRFAFRFFESFDQELALPPGFKPEKVELEARSNRVGIGPLVESFEWEVERL
jgi:hypothetical protein